MTDIRKGTKSDVLKLLEKDWAWRGDKKTVKQYIQELEKGIKEVLVITEGEEPTGELWIFWNSEEDDDHANGKDRAHLSTFRIHPDHRGQGLGTKLIHHAFEIIKEKNFKEVTIGAYVDEPRTQKLYNRWGFTEQIKECIDTYNGNRSCYILLLKKL